MPWEGHQINTIGQGSTQTMRFFEKCRSNPFKIQRDKVVWQKSWIACHQAMEIPELTTKFWGCIAAMHPSLMPLLSVRKLQQPYFSKLDFLSFVWEFKLPKYQKTNSIAAEELLILLRIWLLCCLWGRTAYAHGLGGQGRRQPVYWAFPGHSTSFQLCGTTRILLVTLMGVTGWDVESQVWWGIFLAVAQICVTEMPACQEAGLPPAARRGHGPAAAWLGRELPVLPGGLHYTLSSCKWSLQPTAEIVLKDHSSTAMVARNSQGIASAWVMGPRALCVGNAPFWWQKVGIMLVLVTGLDPALLSHQQPP